MSPHLRSIPLSSICGTSGQSGLKDSLHWKIVEFEEYWGPLANQLNKLNLQTAFLVNAATVYAATEEAALILGRPDRRSDQVELRDEFGTEEVWAFVYLGTWSDRPYWEIESVSGSDHELVVKYKLVLHDLGERTSWEHAYFIPLGKRKPGWFTIHLVDSGVNVEKQTIRIELIAGKALRLSR
jgi:hypothetical protein